MIARPRRPRPRPCRASSSTTPRARACSSAICELPEYYPTRTEIALLRASRRRRRALAGPGAALVEFGSAPAPRPASCWRRCASPARLRARRHLAPTTSAAAAASLAADYPDAARSPRSAPTTPTASRCRPCPAPGRAPVGFFPGSTIGNFTPPRPTGFLRRRGALLGRGLADDRRRRPAEGPGHAARRPTTTPPGVTAAFNRNLLARINRELGAATSTSPPSTTRRAGTPRRAGSRCIWSAAASRGRASAPRRFGFARGRDRSTPRTPTSTACDAFAGLAARPATAAGASGPTRTALFSIHVLEVPA